MKKIITFLSLIILGASAFGVETIAQLREQQWHLLDNISHNDDLRIQHVKDLMMKHSNKKLVALNESMETALHLIFTIERSNMQSYIEWLVRYDPSGVHAQSSCGQTPLFWAVKHSNWEAFELFIEYGADPLIRDNGNKTLLDYVREKIVIYKRNNWPYRDLSNMENFLKYYQQEKAKLLAIAGQVLLPSEPEIETFED